VYLLPGIKQRLKIASSIIFVRPAATDKFGADYEILLLKRNPNLNAFAGFYAFPGGNQDNPGDTFENWKANYPEFSGHEHLGFSSDFSKRIAAIRESFEEINFLLADGDTSGADLRDQYTSKHKSDFLSFCKEKQLLPCISKLKAYTRIAGPINLYPVFDTQFYFYFLDKDHDMQLSMNNAEFTDAKWLSIP